VFSSGQHFKKKRKYCSQSATKSIHVHQIFN